MVRMQGVFRIVAWCPVVMPGMINMPHAVPSSLVPSPAAASARQCFPPPFLPVGSAVEPRNDALFTQRICQVVGPVVMRSTAGRRYACGSPTVRERVVGLVPAASGCATLAGAFTAYRR